MGNAASKKPNEDNAGNIDVASSVVENTNFVFPDHSSTSIDHQMAANKEHPEPLDNTTSQNTPDQKTSPVKVLEEFSPLDAQHSPELELHRSLTEDEEEPAKIEVYNQDVPLELLENYMLHPPTLPPHLLNKVLLNQDIELSYEPTLLPEPQHVMLNHMYALSIKDGVMALSATHRYKRKFVTTLMYKPISI